MGLNIHKLSTPELIVCGTLALVAAVLITTAVCRCFCGCCHPTRRRRRRSQAVPHPHTHAAPYTVSRAVTTTAAAGYSRGYGSVKYGTSYPPPPLPSYTTAPGTGPPQYNHVTALPGPYAGISNPAYQGDYSYPASAHGTSAWHPGADRNAGAANPQAINAGTAGQVTYGGASAPPPYSELTPGEAYVQQHAYNPDHKSTEL